MEPVAEAVGTVGNTERFWRRVFPGFHSLGFAGPAVLTAPISSTRRETDCYAWHDAEVVTLSWMRPSHGR